MPKGGKLTVADFFCGAGGFSEGFRQAGFDVTFALDNWAPAKATHDLNHPDCNCVLMDILELDTPETIEAVVPDTDVIVGSPPCVSFSGSNKAGKADKSLGIKLIEAYLRIVAVKMHKKGSTLKYWAMENVPNSAKYVKKEYSFADLGLPGKGIALTIPSWNILNAANFGAPQTRTRFVCGNYPALTQTHKTAEWVTIKDVLAGLGKPWEKGTTIIDPNYGFKLPKEKLTDHFYDTAVQEFEWKRAKQMKVDHGYMGKMSFPENIDRPSRTIMATRSASTREAMILENKNGYRMPTIREVATFMSFPITYQFEGNNENVKYKLVGNAVCCKLSNALAKAMLKAKGVKAPTSFIPLPDVKSTVDLTGTKLAPKQPQPRHPHAKFALHVPGLKLRGVRAELSNKNSDFSKNKLRWEATIHFGSGAAAKSVTVPASIISQALSKTEGFSTLRKAAASIKKRTDVGVLQDLHVNRANSSRMLSPEMLLDEVRRAVDASYPEKTHGDTGMTVPERVFGRDEIPVRVLAAAYTLDYVLK